MYLKHLSVFFSWQMRSHSAGLKLFKTDLIEISLNFQPPCKKNASQDGQLASDSAMQDLLGRFRREPNDVPVWG